MPKSPTERKAAQRARQRDADLQQKIAVLNQRKCQKCWEPPLLLSAACPVHLSVGIHKDGIL